MINLNGCKKDAHIQLKLGQTLVKIVDNELFYFEEFARVDRHSYKGISFEKFADQYFHNSYESLILSNNVTNTTNEKITDAKECEKFKSNIVVDINRYNIKNGTIYACVPGTINLLMSPGNVIEYELLNTSSVKITDWNDESTFNIIFSPGEGQSIKEPEGNYVLFDYALINNFTYTEKISIELEDYDNGKVVQSLDDWLASKNYENYDIMLQNLNFIWAINKEQVTSKQLKKYDDALILSFGKIRVDTYIRVPKEILFISDKVKYKYIDENTLLIKEGDVTIVYKD